MCKAHKKDFPLRPIVSMINTAEYKLAKYIDNLIKPYIPDRYSVTSNIKFLERLKEFNIKEKDYCLSFDVVSLFTNIPLAETIDMIAERLYSDNNTKGIPSIPKTSLIELLKCATSGIFSHRDKLFQQKDGVSMGNPLAPTLANFFLGCLEETLFAPELNMDKAHPAFYIRYVDDKFCVFREETNYETFFKSLNDMHPSLSFTVEMGGKSLPFLDTRITLNSESFDSTVYRKTTNNDVIMNSSSIAPKQWKSGLIKFFLHRAHNLCSNDQLLIKEIAKLREIFYKNGYSNIFFDQVVQQYKEKIKLNEQTKLQQKEQELTREEEMTEKDEQNKTKMKLRIPYIGGASILFSKRIRRLIRNATNDDCQIIYETTKVKDHFKLKADVPKFLLTKVVYKFVCSRDANVTYIGYTNRTLKERVAEHRTSCTAVSNHASNCPSCKNGISVDDFHVLKKCRNKYDTMIFEAMFIQRQNPVLNRQLIKPGRSFTLRVFN